MKLYEAYNISYDTDDEEVEGLPETVQIWAENYKDACLNGADVISDKTGWCVKSFDVKEIHNKEE